MYREFISKLRCPKCISELKIKAVTEEIDEIIDGILVCSNDHEWSIHEGVLDFNSEEQDIANNWTEMYKEYGYKELDEHIMSMVPDVQKNGDKAVFEYIIKAIEESKFTSVVDIATGRGMLLVELVKHFGDNLDIVCVDLSHMVLKYDRLKCLEINPNVKINYIACDATNMPLKDNEVDLAVSFCGIQNIGDYAIAGVKDSHRVSCNGLLNVGITIKDDNPLLDEISNSLKEAGYDLSLDMATESGFRNIHNLDNLTYEMINVFEGIGGEQKCDLFPIKDHWFAMTIGRTYIKGKRI